MIYITEVRVGAGSSTISFVGTGKKSAPGRDQRIRLLADRGFVRLSKWLTQRYGTGIGRDDLTDACACAVAARDSTARLGDDEVDSRGLRREINY
jgi:hypothetical protein